MGKSRRLVTLTDYPQKLLGNGPMFEVGIGSSKSCHFEAVSLMLPVWPSETFSADPISFHDLNLDDSNLGELLEHRPDKQKMSTRLKAHLSQSRSGARINQLPLKPSCCKRVSQIQTSSTDKIKLIKTPEMSKQRFGDG